MGILSKLVSSLKGTAEAIADRSRPEDAGLIPPQKTQPLPPRRVLVLGCTAPQPATSFLWTEVPHSISIADYETVILDLTPFQTPGTIDFIDAYLPEREKFNQLFFRKDSEIIAIGRPDIEFSRSKSGAFQYTSFWMPRYFPDVETRQAGQDFNVTSSDFSSYLANVRGWTYYWKSKIDPRSRGMYHPPPSIDLFGTFDWGKFRIQPALEPIAQTSFGAPIAFRMQYHFLHPETGELQASSGSMIFLPPTTEISIVDAIAHLLRDRYRIGVEKGPPQWVNGYSLPRMTAAEARIKEIERQVMALEIQRQSELVLHSEESRFLALLYEQGEEILEPLVRDALRALGADVIDPERRGREDGRLRDPFGRKAVLEIKGRENQLPLKDVRQLQDWVSNLRSEGWSKGLLIANVFRNKHPAERSDIYGRNALESAVRDNITLMTTTQLFRALQCYQAGTLELQAFWDMLMCSAGSCMLPELE